MLKFNILMVILKDVFIVLIILCGSEIWCLTSREEHRLRVCESRVVSRIFCVGGRQE